MRTGSYIVVLALTGVLALPSSPVSAQYYSQPHSKVQADVGLFYDNLAPYGDWVEMPDYGWSWVPKVERGWRPYTRGQWVMTDDGWYWDSDERFGWAAYHYGRWVNHPYYGWVWVPGTEWAPAWVSWRHGNGYTGWAPLPPRVTWQTHIGLNIAGLDIDAFIGADDYAFVQDRAFVDRGIYQQIVPPTQNVTIINVTNNITNYGVVNDRVVNRGVAIENVERAVGRRVTRARTVDVDRNDAPRHAKADEVTVYRPQVRVAPERRPTKGISLVKGEAPPPILVERRQVREQEQRQKGNKRELTAKDVAQQGPGKKEQGPGKKESAAAPAAPPRPDAKTQQQETQRQRDQAQQDAMRQRAKTQEQQKLDAQEQADKRAKDAQQVRDQKLQQQQQQQQANQQRAKDAQQARDQQQQEQQQANKQRAKDAQQVRDQQQQQQQANQQRAKDAQQAREQKQTEQRQGNQQQLEQQRAKREAAAQAQADQRAKGAQADKRPKDAPQETKDKGKKGPKPTPTPAPQHP